MDFLEKITTYPNETIYDGCVKAVMGGYEKLATEKQLQRVNGINGILYNCNN